MSRIDVEVRFVGPSDLALAVGIGATFGALGGWWLLYYGVGLTQPDWLALFIALPTAWIVAFDIGGAIEGRSRRAND